jgi:hypothetical protein
LPTFLSIAGFTSSSTRIDGEADPLVLRVDVREGGEPVRVPMVSTPDWLIFSRVPVSCCAGYRYDPAASRATAVRQSDDTLHAGPP